MKTLSQSDVKVLREKLALVDCDAHPLCAAARMHLQDALAILDAQEAAQGVGVTAEDAAMIETGGHCPPDPRPPSDFVLVPRKLTDAMKDVAARISDGPYVSYQEHWDAMLATIVSE